MRYSLIRTTNAANEYAWRFRFRLYLGSYSTTDGVFQLRRKCTLPFEQQFMISVGLHAQDSGRSNRLFWLDRGQPFGDCSLNELVGVIRPNYTEFLI